MHFFDEILYEHVYWPYSECVIESFGGDGMDIRTQDRISHYCKTEQKVCLHDYKQEAQLSLGKADHTAHVRSPASEFYYGEKVICQM